MNESAQVSSGTAAVEPQQQLGERLSVVYHDLNNSLAVISGNAQLLSEMARAEGLDATFVEPIDDIEAARTDISAALDRLDRLRRQIESTSSGGHAAPASAS